jgi:hypothetical protein
LEQGEDIMRKPSGVIIMFVVTSLLFLFFAGTAFPDGIPVTVSDTPINVSLYGVVGDGKNDNKVAIDEAIAAARTAGRGVYFPDGKYLYIGGMNGNGVRFYGQSKAGTILIGDNTNEHNLDGAEDITFQDFRVSDWGASKSRIFRRCKFVSTTPDDGKPSNFYMFYTGFYTYGADNEFSGCDFVFNNIYAALWIRKFDSVLIENCTFNGIAWHNIRLEKPNIRHAKIRISGNTISGGATGIFLGSDRVIPIEDGIVEGNTLYNLSEEAIAFDGFGNNYGLIPVIANGPISHVENDANGRVVIGMDRMLYSDGPDCDGAPAPVSLRNDWTNFYFSFGEGSGQGGTIAEIHSFDPDANTITLELYIPKSDILVGGDGGVQGGFFNWTIRGNTINGTLDKANTYRTAISLYLNVFGFTVENNKIYNYAHGINLIGGQMLTVYRTLAYNNTITGNSIFSGGPDAVWFSSLWDERASVQYNNKLINNTVDGGGISIHKQDKFTNSGNTTTNGEVGVDTENRANTTVVAGSSRTSSTYGQSVTLTATVSTTAATGTVTFMDGATILGTGTLSGGTAIFSTSALTAGNHNIIAVYAGNSSYVGSTSTAITQTVQATVRVTVNAPAGRSVTVDGTTYTSPQAFDWLPGSSHTIATASTQSGSTGTRYVFASWSDGGAMSHNISVPATTTTYTAIFTTQYQLTTAVSPSGSGTVLPASGNWYAAGSSPSIAATAGSGYSFSSWSGPVANYNSTATTVTMTGPTTVTATMRAQALATTLNAGVASRSGTYNGIRTWTIKLANTGSNPAPAAQIDYVNLSYNTRGTCKPTATSTFPVTIGDIPYPGSLTAQFTINFAGCVATDKFNVSIGYSASNGATSGVTSLLTQPQ